MDTSNDARGRRRRLLFTAVRGAVAGLVGTAVMTATLSLEKAARRHSDGPVDYDASGHVVTAAATVLRRTPRTPAGRRALFLLVHWGYGSAVGLGYPALRELCGGREVRSAAAFYLACQTMAMTMFPTLGDTPPPWRWKGQVIVSSLAQHAVYVVAVACAARAMTPSADEPGRRAPEPTVTTARVRGS